MKPYYESSLGKLYCGSCLDIMPELEQVDLTVTSPPYDNLRTYQGYVFNFEATAKELFRITKDGGVVVWVVGDSVVDGGETGTSFTQALFFKSIGFTLYDTMIYMKNGSQYPEQRRYYQCFEYMFVFSKGKPKTINLLADRENKWAGSWGKRSRRNKDGTLIIADKIPYKKFGIRYNAWKINCGHGFSTKDEIAYNHPAIFPEALAQDHILSWSNPNDIILDPMSGSGTVAKMCERLNRRWVACEISEEYCEIVVKRIEQESKRPRFKLSIKKETKKLKSFGLKINDI